MLQETILLPHLLIFLLIDVINSQSSYYFTDQLSTFESTKRLQSYHQNPPEINHRRPLRSSKTTKNLSTFRLYNRCSQRYVQILQHDNIVNKHGRQLLTVDAAARRGNKNCKFSRNYFTVLTTIILMTFET